MSNKHRKKGVLDMRNTEINRLEKENNTRGEKTMRKERIENLTKHRTGPYKYEKIRVYDKYKSGNVLLNEICRKMNVAWELSKQYEELHELEEDKSCTIWKEQAEDELTKWHFYKKLVQSVSNDLELDVKASKYIRKCLRG